MRRILALPLALVLLAAAPAPVLGTTTLDNVAAYHQSATFTWTYAPKANPRYPTLGVFCSQVPGKYAYIAELGIWRTDGTASVLVDNETSSALPGTLDYTAPASCAAYVWDEKLASQGKVAALTQLVQFTILP